MVLLIIGDSVFNNIPKEVILYSVIPVLVIVLLDISLFFVTKNKKDDNFAYNYLIKLSMILAIAFVLPLICGYTWWVIEIFWAKELFFDNFAYIILIIFLSLCLLTLIIWIFLKALEIGGEFNTKKVKRINKETKFD